MRVPKGMTEAYVLQRLEQAVAVLSHQFVFGYYDLDDIRQEARLHAIKKLDKYRPGGFRDGHPVRPLENFFYTVVRNHLLNLVRNKSRRSDPPCNLCHQGRSHEHPGGRVCDKYAEWKARNDRKANLAQPVDLGPADEGCGVEPDVAGEADVAEAERRLDAGLPADLRADYLRLRAGERLTAARRRAVEDACRDILRGFLDE